MKTSEQSPEILAAHSESELSARLSNLRLFRTYARKRCFAKTEQEMAFWAELRDRKRAEIGTLSPHEMLNFKTDQYKPYA